MARRGGGFEEIEAQVAHLEGRILGTSAPRPGDPDYLSPGEVSARFWALMQPFAPTDAETGERATTRERAEEIINTPGYGSPFPDAEAAMITAIPLAGEGGDDVYSHAFVARAGDLLARLNETFTRRDAAVLAGRYGSDRAWLVALMRLQRQLGSEHLRRHLKPWLRGVAAYATEDVVAVPEAEKAPQAPAQAPGGAPGGARRRRETPYPVPSTLGVERW